MLTLQLINLSADGGKNGLGALKLGKNASVKGGANSAINLGDGGRSLSAINDGSRSGNGNGCGCGLGSLGRSRSLGGLSRSCGGSRSSSGGSSGSDSRRRRRLDHV
jgi:hypothetical protein